LFNKNNSVYEWIILILLGILGSYLASHLAFAELFIKKHPSIIITIFLCLIISLLNYKNNN